MGITYCTNGIILQRQLCGPLPQAEIPSLAYHKRHQRSLTVTNTEPLEYISGQRPGPPLMPFVSDALQSPVPDLILIEAKMNDFLWIITRSGCDSNVTVSDIKLFRCGAHLIVYSVLTQYQQ